LNKIKPRENIFFDKIEEQSEEDMRKNKEILQKARSLLLNK
jgi:hypothetical protein